MFLSGLKCLSRLERQVKFAKNRCCKIKPVAVQYNTIYISQLVSGLMTPNDSKLNANINSLMEIGLEWNCGRTNITSPQIYSCVRCIIYKYKALGKKAYLMIIFLISHKNHMLLPLI